jgi:hypothetical protein
VTKGTAAISESGKLHIAAIPFGSDYDSMPSRQWFSQMAELVSAFEAGVDKSYFLWASGWLNISCLFLGIIAQFIAFNQSPHNGQ